MKYLNEFVNSLEFLKKYNKKYRHLGPSKEEVRSTLLNFQNPEFQEVYETALSQLLLPLAYAYLSGAAGKINVVNNCHSISHGYSVLAREKLASSMALNVTIGDVSFNGEPIYNVGRTKLKRILARGPELDKSLDLHVWITLEDMTVIDLTIMQTLAHRDLVSNAELNSSPIVTWREGSRSQFQYHPLLVDNDFLHRVDKISYAV